MAGRNGRRVPALICLAALGACAAVPPPSSRDTIDVSWEISLEHDSCAKLAGFVALNALFRVGGDAAVRARISETIDRRCPDFADMDPETPDLTIIFPASACDELEAMLGMAAAFDATVVLDLEERRLADDLMGRLESEMAARCL